MDDSQIDAENGLIVNTWDQWNIPGIVPEGATTVQIGALYH